jgi:cobyrinic acid a,c-diamide synthase
MEQMNSHNHAIQQLDAKERRLQMAERVEKMKALQIQAEEQVMQQRLNWMTQTESQLHNQVSLHESRAQGFESQYRRSIQILDAQVNNLVPWRPFQTQRLPR